MAHRYSEAFKARQVERIAAPGGPSVPRLAHELNIPTATLYRWLQAAGTLGDMSKKRTPQGPNHESRSTRDWTPADKLRVITQGAALKDEELGEFLRREGLHHAQLEEWKADILAALAAPPTAPRASPGVSAKVVRDLERELARKDKALAEVTALLVLKKKVDALCGAGGEDDSTDPKSGKK
jgi:transposase-like protein